MESHHLAIHYLSYKQSWWSRRVRRRKSRVYEQGQSFILWSRVSFLLFLSSHHLKDLPNKSIMLNQHGENDRGCNLAYKRTLQVDLINTLVRETLAFHYQLHKVRTDPLCLKRWYCMWSGSSHCFPSESSKSRLSWWILLILLLLSYSELPFSYMKKEFILSSAALLDYPCHLWLR